MTILNQINPTFTQFPEPSLIQVNGIQLEVFETGQENKGNPIVLCHGFPEHAYSWRYQIHALANAGYHVIVPNQRGYGNSSCPTDVEAYGIEHLTGDLVALLEYYGYQKAIFVGHDWGANVVWRLAQMHPKRVSRIINLALPYQERGERPWIEMMETVFGEEFYFVHLNKQPDVADVVLNQKTTSFLTHMFRKNIPLAPPKPGMVLMQLAQAEKPEGDPVMSEKDLSVFISSFQTTGFTGSLNWYRNLDKNWHTLAHVNPMINHPTLMIYGDQDMIPKFERLSDFVPNLDVITLNCGHWIQQEQPEETTRSIIKWLKK